MTLTLDRVPLDTFRFADCEVDLRRRELRRQGHPVAAERKVFDLLVYLIENRDRAVDKDELQQAIWAGASVTDAALTRCVMKVRRLVGDDPKHQAIIKTIHGHGYHFVAKLEEAAEARPTSELSPSIAKYREALRIPDRLSIAVLPFKNLGNDPDQQYFAEGITDDVVTELSRFSSLFVTAPSSTKYFEMNSEDARSFAQKLAVAYFVQGTIRRSGARIRITVHLAEVASERRLWSEHYDREIQELPIIHDEVSRTIAATIGGRVEAHRARQALDRAGVQAYDLILRAKELHYRVSKSANAEALPLLEQAIEIDPNNARAHAWLASVHVMNGWFRWTADPDESTRLSVEYGRQAVEMDDSDYVAHYVYAEALHGVREWAIAESHFERALQLNPNDIAARSAYCLLLVSTGRAEEAVQHMVVAERLDPFGLAWTPWVKGAVMFTVGRYKEAIRAFSQVEDMHNVIRPWLAAAYAHEGDLNQARLLLKQFFDTARAEMGSFPGKDLELWQDYLRSELAYREESDFLHVYEVLLKAGWQELIAALPDSSQ